MDDVFSLSRPVDELHAAIVEHFDGMIDLYEELWGEHIHHGFWAPGDAGQDRHAAQARTVHELIAFGEVPRGAHVLDAGSGIGAASILLARELGCRVDGITLSGAQVERARAKAGAAGVAESVRFHVADALATPFAARTFDVVWALEICELLPDKLAFFRECMRVLKPGGRLIVATWCCRDDRPTRDEAALLRRLYREMALAYVLPLRGYAGLCEACGFADVRAADWTENTRHTWDLTSEAVAPLVRNPRLAWSLIRRKGLDVFRFLRAVPLMRQAYARGVMRYGVVRASSRGA
ncbi:methyltransferase domain-containing protein [Nannocystis pusilla]|uniref:Methyltransferase domain-containing protein n=1 Tax=Nannocystis pusilla TaxID=889268 RepID=A0ABS7U562_9BACT|nr:methyltransferase domain-containing protein [Nannocystis pusilla]MBZ5715687.1 methyltransferase domain-containing protein [Nannocystis pusilla]